MTLNLEELKMLCAEADAGSWIVADNPIVSTLINALPELIAEVERLRAYVTHLEAVKDDLHE